MHQRRVFIAGSRASPQCLRDVLDPPHTHSGQVHLDQSFFHRRLAPRVTLNGSRLEGQIAQLRNRQCHIPGLGLQMPIIAARPYALAAFAVFILPCSAKLVRLRIQQRVQRLFHRGPNHLVQVRLDAPFINLNCRPDGRLAPLSHLVRLQWLAPSLSPRGFAPPACTSPQLQIQNQMCESSY